MILPYFLRLLCLCFASFFLLHGAFALSAWLSMKRVIHASDSMRPRAAARFLLVLRLAPAIIAFVIVGGLCIPSYLWLEGNAAGERVGWICCAAALLGAAMSASSLMKGARAAWVSMRHFRRFERERQKVIRRMGSSPVVLVNGKAPLMALTGMLKPEILVSRAVFDALSREQLEAALQHEQAHGKSHDNLKRLLLALAPDVFPFTRTFAALERRWARFTEWAADDDAVAGDAGRSISLAGALVQFARMDSHVAIPPLASSLLGKNDELAARVERLLGAEPVHDQRRHAPATRLCLAAFLLTATLAVLLHPTVLQSVHALMERLLQ